jgi:peptidyl-prolyl cis-trans isomerase B (cyclophilin B)
MSENNPKVEIIMKDGGKIEIELDRTAAPITVENFLKLVNEGFYDGLTFHRIIPNFVIQGGDPKGDGTGGSEATIQGEFASNGWTNPISHKRGVISMARAQDPNSATSQFFITNADAFFLDEKYASFGYVTTGLDVVDEITAVAKDANDKPITPVVIQTIREI